MLAIHKMIILLWVICLTFCFSSSVFAQAGIADSKARYHKAVNHYKRGHTSISIQCLKKALALNPANDVAHLITYQNIY
ncbi:MAG: hypothetical protein HC912_06075 [Saprospiraceae bacterium]|nr:hypothetical protein [Saprospiraceae bacterium]